MCPFRFLGSHLSSFFFLIRVHSMEEPGSSILAFARVLGSISAGFPPLCDLSMKGDKVI